VCASQQLRKAFLAAKLFWFRRLKGQIQCHAAPSCRFLSPIAIISTFETGGQYSSDGCAGEQSLLF
jgi:hypothetical protein